MALHVNNGGHGTWLPERDVKDDEGQVLIERKHSTLQSLLTHRLLDEEEAAGLLKFCAVRNPFDSLVSLYTKLRDQYVPLLENPDSFVHRAPGFVDDIHFVRDHSFSDWVLRKYKPLDDGNRHHLYGPFIRGMDVVVHYEELQTAVNEVLERVGAEPVEIPTLNITEGREPDYRPYYSRRARRLVSRVFAADLERFGYAF